MKKFISLTLVLVFIFTNFINTFALSNNEKIMQVVFQEFEMIYPEDGGELIYNNVSNFFINFKSINNYFDGNTHGIKVGANSCIINPKLRANIYSSEVYYNYTISCNGKLFKSGFQEITIDGKNIGRVKLVYIPYEIGNSFGTEGYKGIRYSDVAYSVEGSLIFGTNVGYKTVVGTDYKISNSNLNLEMDEYNGVKIGGEVSGVPEVVKKLGKKVDAEIDLSLSGYAKLLFNNLLKSKYSSINDILGDKNALNNFIRYLELQDIIVNQRIYSENGDYEKGGKCLIDEGNIFDNIVHPSLPTKGDKQCSSYQVNIYKEWLAKKKIISGYQQKVFDSYKDYYTKIKRNGYAKDYSDCIIGSDGRYVIKGGNGTTYSSYSECINTINRDNKAVYDLFRGIDAGINKNNVKLIYRDLLSFLVNQGYKIGENFKLNNISTPGYKIAKKSDNIKLEGGGEIGAEISRKDYVKLGARIEGLSSREDEFFYDNFNNNEYPELNKNYTINFENEYKLSGELNVGLSLGSKLDTFFSPRFCYLFNQNIYGEKYFEYDGKEYYYNLVSDVLRSKIGDFIVSNEKHKREIICDGITSDIIVENLKTMFNTTQKINDFKQKLINSGLTETQVEIIITGIKALIFEINFSANKQFNSSLEYSNEEKTVTIRIYSSSDSEIPVINSSGKHYYVKEYVYKFKNTVPQRFIPGNSNLIPGKILSYKNNLEQAMKSEDLLEDFTINNYHILSTDESEDNSFGIRSLAYISGDSTSKEIELLDYTSHVDTKTGEEILVSQINGNYDLSKISDKIINSESEKDKIFNIYAMVYITFFGYNLDNGVLTPNNQNRDGGANKGITPSKFKKSDIYFNNN